MLTIIPKGWFSWDFNILDGDKKLALIDLAWTREAGVLLLDGQSYKVHREHWFGGAFMLEQDGQVLARAIKPSAWKRALQIEHGEHRYILKPVSSFGRSFELVDGERVIGSIRPQHAFTRKANIDFPESIPLPVRTFMVWLTIILWKRESDAAAAG
jgi:hypothetical protein